MTLLRALAFHPAVVEAAVDTGQREKKMAEFSLGAGQGGPAADAVVASGSASVNRMTSRAVVYAPPLAKGRHGAAPDIEAFLAESERVLSPYGGQVRFSASDKAAGAQGGDRSDIPMHHAHASHVAGLAAPEHNPAAGVSAPALALTGVETPSLLGRAPTTRQATAVDGADESFMEAYASSSFDDEARGEWQTGAVIPENAAPPVPPPGGDNPLPSATAQLLQARTALLRRQESEKTKKTGPSPERQKAAVSALVRLTTVGERAQQRQSAAGREDSMKMPSPAAYRRHTNQQPEVEPAALVTAPKTLCTALEHEKTPELALSLAEEVLERDPWAAQVHRLAVPKLVQQLALNAWKEDLAPGKVCLHLRASQRHLNSATAQNVLRAALSADLGAPVELTVMEDDNPAVKTPLEWRLAIYKEKLMRAREAMMNDSHIQMLRRFFDAELDEDSIRLV